jgi:hypothetical protein
LINDLIRDQQRDHSDARIVNPQHQAEMSSSDLQIGNQQHAPSRNSNVSKFNSVGNPSKSVPRLDFKKLKKVQEFKDWYAYACKLEDSVKFLRDRVRSLEADNDSLNDKYRKEVANREQLFIAND